MYTEHRITGNIISPSGPWPKSCMQSPEKNFECLESWGTQFCSTAIQKSPCYAGTSPSSHRPIDDWAFPPNCAPTFTHFIITSWFLPSLFLLWQPLIVPPSPYSPKSITPCLPTLWLSQDPPPHLPHTPFSNNPKTQIWIQKLDCGWPTWVAQ